MKKINVLVLNADTDGVGYWRLLSPFSSMDEPDVNVEIRLMMDSTLRLVEENFLSKYNIIVHNKPLPFSKEVYIDKFNEIVKKLNIKVIYDIDDYWVLSNAHPNYKAWKKNNIQEKIENQLRNVDHVTTTTHFLAEKIKTLNPNVTILPNSVNLKEQQWVYNKKSSDKLRFLWGGGITHLVDLRLLNKSFEKIDKNMLRNIQMYLCGYDLRMNTPQGMKKADPRKSTWSFFENIFTNNRKWIKNADYGTWLRSASDNGRDNYGIKEEFKSEFYQRRWTKPILLYGTMYNEADVVFAPLKNNNMFNIVKSQLKVVEAGAHKCPIICSNYGPYTIDDIEGEKDGKRKGFLVDENELGSSVKWLEHMKYYYENPDKVKEHGDNLYQYVKNNYEINDTNKKRVELFKKLLNK